MSICRPTARSLFIAALLISAVTLGAVLTMQYGFGLKPCELCTFQRIPYAAAILLSAATLTAGPSPRRQVILLGILSLLFLASTGLGIYHAGVEKQIFPGPTACTSAPNAGELTIEQLREQITNAPIVACNQPQWEWHGVTLALLNAFWSLALFLAFLSGYLQQRKTAHD